MLFAAMVRPATAQVGSGRYSAIVMEAGSGRVILGVNQDALRYPASLTKLMTLYMTFEALRDRRVQLNQTMMVSAFAAAQPPSKLGLIPGEPLTVEQAILGLVTKSANDVAASLGELLGGTEDRFAQMMTLRARAIGMSRTSFRNASGLPDPDQWTTARDLATLGRRLVIDFPRYYGYFGVSGFIWHNRLIPNHDRLLQTYPGADGMKTGFTDSSGHNLVSSAVRDGVRLVGVVMGAASNYERDQHMITLLDNGFGRSAATSVVLANGGYKPIANEDTAAIRTTLLTPIERAHTVQMGPYPDRQTAWQVAQEATERAPAGEPRAQQMVVGHRAMYVAQLVGLSEVEAKEACLRVPRRGAECQMFRPDAGNGPSR